MRTPPRWLVALAAAVAAVTAPLRRWLDRCWTCRALHQAMHRHDRALDRLSAALDRPLPAATKFGRRSGDRALADLEIRP